MEQISVLPIRVLVASVLRKAILSGNYSEGQELSLTEVSKELGVSRTPVREAFQALASEGLLTLHMNRGATVNGINEEFVRDHFELRIALEAEAVYLACSRGGDISELLKLQESYENRTGLLDYSTYNEKFHLMLWTLSGNRRLKELLTTLWNGPSRARHDKGYAHERLSVEEHRRVLDALLLKDCNRAAEQMRKHIERSMDNVLGDFRNSFKGSDVVPS